MEWLNLHASTLDSDAFVGAEPTNRATWLCLLRYCMGQENGGRIASCAVWKDRKWQQAVKVTKEESLAECDLWEWDGADLIVRFYPEDKEAKVRANRANGKKGGRPKKPKQNPTITQPLTQPLTQPETEGEGKEKEKEGVCKNSPPSDLDKRAAKVFRLFGIESDPSELWRLGGEIPALVLNSAQMLDDDGMAQICRKAEAWKRSATWVKDWTPKLILSKLGEIYSFKPEKEAKPRLIL